MPNRSSARTRGSGPWTQGRSGRSLLPLRGRRRTCRKMCRGGDGPDPHAGQLGAVRAGTGLRHLQASRPPTLFDLTDEEAEAVIQTIRRMADALVRAYDPDGVNLIQNNGVVAGQHAPHFHMHVVPRRRSGSDRGNGPPHIAVLEGKTPTRLKRDVIVSLEREQEIANPIRRHLDMAPRS